MLDEEQLAAAKKICELFLWEKPESIEITFAELKKVILPFLTEVKSRG